MDIVTSSYDLNDLWSAVLVADGHLASLLSINVDNVSDLVTSGECLEQIFYRQKAGSISGPEAIQCLCVRLACLFVCIKLYLIKRGCGLMSSPNIA